MKRRTRYSLIASGAVIFLIIAPLVVLLVGGVKYNFFTKEYEQTGILAVTSDPKGADISLNDAVTEDDTPTNFRFLTPGEYTIMLNRDGYFPWSKRLTVEAGKATTAAGALDKIYLLKNSTQPRAVASEVLDIFVGEKIRAYLQDTRIVLLSGSEYTPEEPIIVPSGLHTIVASTNEEYLIVTSRSSPSRTAYVRLRDRSVREITSFTQTTSYITPGDDGFVYGVEQTGLVRIDPTTGQKIPLGIGVDVLTIEGSTAYVVHQEPTNRVLSALSLTTDNATPQTLLENLPLTNPNTQILVTRNRDVVLRIDETLYKVNSTLETIATGVQDILFNSARSQLSYVANGEINWYNFNANSTNLMTRSGAGLRHPAYDPSIGYGFYSQDQKLWAMELDNRNRQNLYQLTTTGTVSKLRWDGSNATLVYLSDSALTLLNLR